MGPLFYIEVKTRLGDVTLPRQQIYKWRVVCPYDIRLKKGKASVCFYHGYYRKLKEELFTDAKMIGKIGEVTIYQQI